VEEAQIGTKADMQPRLRLIKGGQHCELLMKAVRIVVAPEDRPPFNVDAVAVEEDTFLVMSEAGQELPDTDEHPVRIMTRAIEVRPVSTGTVLVKRGHPLMFLAIVNDFDVEPSLREEWVADAIYEIFRESERRKIQSLALPLIGTAHGLLSIERFLYLFHLILTKVLPIFPKQLWLIAPTGASSEIFRMLEMKISN